MKGCDESVKRFTSFLLALTIIFSLSACGSKKPERTPPVEEEMEFSEFDWPKSDIAKLIPTPRSNIGYIKWEADYGFVIYVAETSQEEYKEYVDSCWDEGFTIDYRRGDDFFWADNEDGYKVSVRFEENNVMWIRMDEPDEDQPATEPSDTSSEPSSSEPSEPAQSNETPSEPQTNEPEETPKPLYYSTNTLEQAKSGNSGVFAYKRNTGNYYIYWIVNFDEGCAYTFIDGNGNGTCDRVQIDDGDLNSYITVTYHDGDDSWQYGLCFKRVRQPGRLIQSEEDGTQYEFIATDLNDTLKIRDGLEIVDY